MPKIVKVERPKIMALLQCQWFKNPERMKAIYARYLDHEKGEGRQRFIRDFLFFGCLTGKRLSQAFEPMMGDEFRWKIVWEEVSTEIGDNSASVFQVDPSHVGASLKLHEPKLLILFGKVAESVLCYDAVEMEIKRQRIKLLHAPYPAARGADVSKRLAQVANDANEWLTVGIKENG